MKIVRPQNNVVRPQNNIVRPLKLINLLTKVFAHRKLGHAKLAKFGLLTRNPKSGIVFLSCLSWKYKVNVDMLSTESILL